MKTVKKVVPILFQLQVQDVKNKICRVSLENRFTE